jgi:hypothetical protein
MIRCGEEGVLRTPVSVFLSAQGVLMQGGRALCALRDGVPGEVHILDTLDDVDELVEVVLFKRPEIDLSKVRALPWGEVTRTREALKEFATLTCDASTVNVYS